jgi:hypothetical protein
MRMTLCHHTKHIGEVQVSQPPFRPLCKNALKVKLKQTQKWHDESMCASTDLPYWVLLNYAPYYWLQYVWAGLCH